MGAENTPYVRAVTRKTLAAVARIYEPGIKFDSVLVLNGPQGCGKSFFCKTGKEWYSDSLTISDMKDGKTAAEKLQVLAFELGDCGYQKGRCGNRKIFLLPGRMINTGSHMEQR